MSDEVHKAAALAVDEARKAAADGKLDATGAISAALRAVTELGPLLSEFKAKA